MQVIHSLGGVTVIKRDITEIPEGEQMVVTDPITHTVNTCLPVYNDINKQLRYQKFYYADISPLIAPNNRFLPFQILRPNNGRSVSKFNIINVNTGNSVSHLTYFNSNYTIETLTELDYQYIMYKGDVALGTNLSNGDYYLEIGDGEYNWYSECFHVCDKKINATSETIYAEVGDGEIEKLGTVWDDVKDATSGDSVNTTNATQEIRSTKSGSDFTIDRYFVMFNTSSLPDKAQVLSATFGVKVDTGNGAGIYLRKGGQGTSLGVDDYDNFKATSLGSLASPILSSVNEIELNSDGIENVNKRGYTRIAMLSDLDAGDVAPTDTSHVTNFYTANTATQANRPHLDLTYEEHDDYIKIEFWDDIDLGDVRYKYGSDLWKQEIYLKTNIKNEDIKVEDTISDKDGYQVLEKRVSQDIYRMHFIVPQFLVKTIHTIPSHNTVRIINTNGELIEPKNITFGEPVPMQGGAFFRMTMDFITSSIVKKHTNINMT